MTWGEVKLWINLLDADQLSAEAELVLNGEFVPITGFAINYGDGQTTKDRPHLTAKQEKNDD